jgi:mucin-19
MAMASATPSTLTISAGTAGDVTFTGLVGDSTPLGAVTINNAKDVEFNGLRAESFKQLAGAGTTTLNSGTFTTGSAGVDIAANAITLAGDVATSGADARFRNAVTLGSAVAVNSANGTITFDSSINGPQALTLTGGTGTITLAGTAGTDANSANRLASLTITSASTANLANVFTTGAQTFSADAIALAGATSLGATSATFNGVLNGGSLEITGDAVFNALVGNTAALGSLSVSGTSALNGDGTNPMVVTTTGSQTYTGAVTLADSTTLTGAAINLDGGASSSGAGLFTVANSGALRIAAGTSLSLDGGFLQSGAGAVNLGGDITSSNDEITFTGAVTLIDAVTLGTNTTTAGGKGITFKSTLDSDASSRTLSLSTGLGDVLFTGAVGGSANGRLGAVTIGQVNALDIRDGLKAASFDQASATAATGAVTISGDLNANTGAITLSASSIRLSNGSITTAGTDITINDPITLVAGTGAIGTGTDAGNIVLNNTVDGAEAFEITAGTGTATLNGDLNVASVEASGATINLNGGTDAVTTSGTQLYTGAVVLGGATSLSGSTITFDGTLNNGSLTLTGNAEFKGAVGQTTALGSLSVSGTTLFNEASGATLDLATSGAQTYTGAVTLSSDASLTTTGGDLTFSDTVTGAQALTLAAGSGAIEAVGVINAASLTINSASSATLNDVITSGDQAITAGAISLSSDTYTATAGTITLTGATRLDLDTSFTANTTTFAGTLDSSDDGAASPASNLRTLTVTGNAAFEGDVGSTDALGSIAVSQASSFGKAALGALSLTTSGTQTFTGAATLLSDTTLTTTNSAIWFKDTVDGAKALTLAAGTGNVTLSGIAGTAIGDANALASLTINSAHTAALNNVFTSGAQTLTATAISLSGSYYGASTVTFNGDVSGTSFTVAGNAVFNGDGTNPMVVTSTGSQSYTGSITLGANSTINVVGLDAQAISQQGFNLIVNETGTSASAGSIAWRDQRQRAPSP